MGSQTMASHGGGGGGGGSGGSHRTDSHIQTLPRQGSLYNLTLNEVQTQLGEPLLSMNLDELLKSIFPEGTAESASPPRATTMAAGSGLLPRQGSITMLPPALSKKTVDEVWRGISGQEEEDDRTGDDQLLLGEMTLESFLIKAGVVLDENGTDLDATGNLTGSGGGGSCAINVGQAQHRGMQWFGSGWQMGPGTVIDAMYPVGGGGGRREEVLETTPPGRKTVSGHTTSTSGEMVMDKMMERRQKRMIKNRESAARSRARKQAYTNELENKVSRLEEENERLKKQKVLDKILCAGPPPAPKYQLRRTSSAPF